MRLDILIKQTKKIIIRIVINMNFKNIYSIVLYISLIVTHSFKKNKWNEDTIKTPHN